MAPIHAGSLSAQGDCRYLIGIGTSAASQRNLRVAEVVRLLIFATRAGSLTTSSTCVISPDAALPLRPPRSKREARFVRVREWELAEHSAFREVANDVFRDASNREVVEPLVGVVLQDRSQEKDMLGNVAGFWRLSDRLLVLSDRRLARCKSRSCESRGHAIGKVAPSEVGWVHELTFEEGCGRAWRGVCLQLAADV